MLRIECFADHESASRFAADWMLQSLRGAPSHPIVPSLREDPSPLLCVASGSTPTRAYELFAESARRDRGGLASLHVIKLDEWVGLEEGSPGTCEEHLRRVLIDPLELADRYLAFQSMPADPDADCRRMAEWLAANGPIDACVLGLGVNGHLGFNEPAAALRPHAHVADLSAASLGHAMVRDTAARPTAGVTLGMADLLQSRRLLILATGEAKREAVAQLLRGEVRTDFPATFALLHGEAVLAIDRAADPRQNR